MSDATEPFLTREELHDLHEKFRELKHSINNTLAVIMALSELGQRNPAHLEKLAKAVLQRGPDVVQQMQEFQNALGSKLKTPQASSAPNAQARDEFGMDSSGLIT